MRLDQYLYNQKFFRSREKAKQAVENGEVIINGEVASKASKKTQPTDIIEVKSQGENYVSRAGHKLESALERYKIDPMDFTCLDIGSSTGGFTQCLLNRGSKTVYAVDVGSDQMHPSLTGHPKLQLYENTDFRIFDEKLSPLDLVVIDVSFISLRKIIPNLLRYLNPETIVLALFKPQFEVGKEHLKKGICRHPDIQAVIDNFAAFLKEHGLQIPEKAFKVPLKGKEGNQEYVLKITQGT